MFRYIIAAALLFAACSGAHKADYEVKAELELIDTLQTRLQTIKSWLDYMPLEEIQERKDIIDHNFSFCEEKFGERFQKHGISMDLETAQLLDEYKGYGKLYGKAKDSFKPVVMEMEELLIQLKTLKESAYGKDYKKETFLAYFHKEKADVERLYALADQVLRPVKETDLSFERAQKRVEEIAEGLKD